MSFHLETERERQQAVAIAKARDERDLRGAGLAVVLRRATRDYIRRHRDELPPHLRD